MSFTKNGWIVAVAISFLPNAGAASGLTDLSFGRHAFEEGGAAASLGKLKVPAEKMAGQCITKVTPHYPQNAEEPRQWSSVLVLVVIGKSGNVSPVRVVSGKPAFQSEALNIVRLWRYRPYTRDGEPLDVATEIRVEFDPAKAGGMVIHPTL